MAVVRDGRAGTGSPVWCRALSIPPRAGALVVILDEAQGQRRGARRQRVEPVLRGRGIATLPVEWRDADGSADPEPLAGQLARLLDRLARHEPTRDLRLGLFGASLGADAALIVATERPGQVLGLVARGGMPDLAAGRLECVEAPTLLIVAAHDPERVERNQVAFRRLQCVRRLEVLPGTTRRFEEPGALQSVAELAANWFDAHLWGAGATGTCC
jgi:putative phosphoribosyl transferase